MTIKMFKEEWNRDPRGSVDVKDMYVREMIPEGKVVVVRRMRESEIEIMLDPGSDEIRIRATFGKLTVRPESSNTIRIDAEPF